MMLFDAHAALAQMQEPERGPANPANPAKRAAIGGHAHPPISELARLARAKPAHAVPLPPHHWQLQFLAHLEALHRDKGVVWVSEGVLESTAHIRTAWDWLAENDLPVGTYTEEECQARLSRARVALAAAGVKPCLPLEELDRHHCARLRDEGALAAIEAIEERAAIMAQAPEYPGYAEALVAAFEDARKERADDAT